MILRQFLQADRSPRYLFGCVGHARAAVVDPARDVEPYLGNAHAGPFARARLVARHRPHARPRAMACPEGHMLMVGDLARSELATSAKKGARDLFRSAQRFKELPDYLEVLRGAYAGSVCGGGLSGKPAPTIGFEKHPPKSRKSARYTPDL